MPDYRISVRRTHALVANPARLAASLSARLVGLLRHDHLEPDEGLVLPACQSVHTWFMRFPIDLVFVDRRWRVVALQPSVRPWRFSPWVVQAWGVIELAAGTVERLHLQVGDELTAAPVEPAAQPISFEN